MRDVRLKNGETIRVVPDTRFGAYMILTNLNGDVVSRSDHNRNDAICTTGDSNNKKFKLSDDGTTNFPSSICPGTMLDIRDTNCTKDEGVKK